jgi:hypothetical protein
MTTPLTFVRDRFFRLIQKDSDLSQSIQDVQFKWQNLGLIAEILPNPGCTNRVGRKLLKITAILLALSNIVEIRLKGRRTLKFLVCDLLELCPAIENIPMQNDLQHEQEIPHARQGKILECLLKYHQQQHSVFVIGTNGTYQDIWIHQGTTSKTPPEEMLGKPIDQFVGLEAAAYLRSRIQKAYEENQALEVSYRILFYPDKEERQYQGEIIPLENMEAVLLLCKRVEIAKANPAT